MSKYLLIYTGGHMPKGEEAQAKVMKAWEDWLGGLGAAAVDPGNPIGPDNKKIESNGDVSDEGFNPGLTGYSILEADSLENATKLAQGCPGLKDGGQVYVYEIFNAM